MKKDKKVNKAEQREQARTAKTAAYSERDRELAAARKKEEEAKKAEAARLAPVPREINVMEAGMLQLANAGDYAAIGKALERTADADAKKKKSAAKAAGLKSLFTVDADGSMVMTSFGHGNAATREKEVHGSKITDLTAEPVFTAEAGDKQFRISGRMHQQADVDNPVYSQKAAGSDLTGMREQLERLYFGRTYADNIHIQLIYNILDIDKILATHVNNIVYEVNNLLRDMDSTDHDLIGSLSVDTKYETFIGKKDSTSVRLFEALMKMPQRAYFGDALYRKPGKDETDEQKEQEKRRCYYILCLLGLARQALAHGSGSKRNAIYLLDAGQKQVQQEAMAVLDELYNRKISDLNRNFLKNAEKKNLPILFDALNAKDEARRRQIVCDYYDFVVRKEFKNQGFSITTLREIMLTIPEASVLAGQKYDSVRSKLYMLIDYVIFDRYRNDPAAADELVGKLRSAMNDVQKQAIYTVEAGRLWARIGSVIRTKIAAQLDERHVKDIAEVKLDESILKDVRIRSRANGFSKLMYLFTCFQDGKEINILLTTLINKLENIDSFIRVMDEMHIEHPFTRDYAMFENSGAIARELRTVNSFARMTGELQATKPAMFKEAARLLGFTDSEKALDRIVTEMLDKETGERIGGKKNYGFRNFIINNVMESKRFQYLIRYTDPAKARLLAQNGRVVGFVLKDIPDAQIKRYYNSCTGMNESFTSSMRDDLARMIAGVNFRDFADLTTNVRFQCGDQAIEIERKKSIVRLYLTVLYLLVKNLIYVNSRYFLAFHCVERDSIIYDPAYSEAYGRDKDYGRYARDRVEQGLLNRRATGYVNQNIANSDPLMVRGFRNCVEHLDAVRDAALYINDIGQFDSYFELYHYLVQRYLIHDLETDEHVTEDMINPAMLRYCGLVKKYHTCCKDMIKALNVPFAYNLPRYKNLSINELFDRDNYLPDKGKTKELEPSAEE